MLRLDRLIHNLIADGFTRKLRRSRGKAPDEETTARTAAATGRRTGLPAFQSCSTRQRAVGNPDKPPHGKGKPHQKALGIDDLALKFPKTKSFPWFSGHAPGLMRSKPTPLHCSHLQTLKDQKRVSATENRSRQRKYAFAASSCGWASSEVTTRQAKDSLTSPTPAGRTAHRKEVATCE